MILCFNTFFYQTNITHSIVFQSFFDLYDYSNVIHIKSIISEVMLRYMCIISVPMMLVISYFCTDYDNIILTSLDIDLLGPIHRNVRYVYDCWEQFSYFSTEMLPSIFKQLIDWLSFKIFLFVSYLPMISTFSMIYINSSGKNNATVFIFNDKSFLIQSNLKISPYTNR